MFKSIQGEGIDTGKPFIFLRLSGCNKKCIWKNGSCDTKYASFQCTEFFEKEPEELIDLITQMDIQAIIYTGGEPLLQQDDLLTIAKRLSSKGYYQAIETNGSIYPSKSLQFYIDFFSISPKLPSSSNKEFDKDIENLRNFLFGVPIEAYQIKFVIDTTDIASDMEQVMVALHKMELPKGANVIFQPEGLTEDLHDYARRGALLAEFLIDDVWTSSLMKYDWRVLYQNHRLMWNNERRR